MDHPIEESDGEQSLWYKKLNLESVTLEELKDIIELLDLKIVTFVNLGKLIKYFTTYLNDIIFGYNLWNKYSNNYENVIYSWEIWSNLTTDVPEFLWSDVVNNEYIELHQLMENKAYKCLQKNTDLTVNSFDINDEYYLINYIDYVKRLKLKSDGPYLSEKDKNRIIKTLSRCCRQLITAGHKSYIIKESKSKPFVIVPNMKYEEWIYIKYTKDNERKTQSLNIFDISLLNSLPKYNEIVCKPYHTDISLKIPEYEFNIFKGFKANYDEKADYTKIQPFLNHIKTAWANNDDYLYEYILSWLAYPIQKLTKSGVAVFMKGKQGSGKSFIFDFLHKFVYGSNTSLVVPSLEHVMGKFNALLAGKLLIYVEETGVSDKSWTTDFNKFKPQITSATILIEPKTKDIYPVDNVSNYMITSNHDGVKIEQGDRRYLVIECKNEYLNNTDYFKNIHDNYFNQECGDIFYSFLRDYDLIPLNPIPSTEYKQQLIMNGISKHELFLKGIFTQESVGFDPNFFRWNKEECKYYFIRNDLYEMYCNRYKNQKPVNSIIFFKLLNEVPGISKAIRIRINSKQTNCSYIDPSLYKTIQINSIFSDDSTPLEEYYKKELNM